MTRKERRALLARGAAPAVAPIVELPRSPELELAAAAHAELARQVDQAAQALVLPAAALAPRRPLAGGLAVIARSYDADGFLISGE